MVDDLKKLEESFNKTLAAIPIERKKLMGDVGELLYQKVVSNIDATVDSQSGDLKNAVEVKQGSGGGYVAIKPNFKKAPHTHLIENGHKVDTLPKNNKRIKPKRDSKKKYTKKYEQGEYIPGKHMYRNALRDSEEQIVDMSTKTLKRIKEAGFG